MICYVRMTEGRGSKYFEIKYTSLFTKINQGSKRVGQFIFWYRPSNLIVLQYLNTGIRHKDRRKRQRYTADASLTNTIFDRPRKIRVWYKSLGHTIRVIVKSRTPILFKEKAVLPWSDSYPIWYNLVWFSWWCSVSAWDSWSKGRWFDFRPRRYQVN